MSVLRHLPALALTGDGATRPDRKHHRDVLLQGLWSIFLVLVLSACTPAAPADLPAATPAACGDFILPDAALTCLELVEGVLLQTGENTQSVVVLYDGTLTIRGTVYLHRNPSALTLTVMALEGTAVLGARQSTRIMPAGSQVILSLDENNQISNVSNVPVPVDTRLLDGLARAELPRAVGTLIPIAAPPGYLAPPTRIVTDTPIDPTQLARGTLVPRATVCVPREDWFMIYTIRSGDNLSRLATTYGITSGELQSGNCLLNPDRLSPGDEIRVPPLPTVTPFAAATYTPSAVAFRPDRDTLAIGECTVIRWDVYNVSAVFFEEETTSSSNVRQVCPPATTLYVLRVVYPDGSQTTHQVTVTVTP